MKSGAAWVASGSPSLCGVDVERCEPCQGKNHSQCKALLKDPFAWCECSIDDCEERLVRGAFIADAGVLDHGTVVPLLDDDDIV